MTTARKITSVRQAMRARQAARQQRRTLERELAGYTTPAERTELDAILARHTPEQTRVVERILARQAVRQTTGTRPPR